MKITIKTYLVLIISMFSLSIIIGQCPEGEPPIFRRVAQIDSFQNIYPGCDDYKFYGYYKNGIPIDPPTENTIGYLVTMATLLSIILFGSHILFRYSKYFNSQLQ